MIEELERRRRKEGKWVWGFEKEVKCAEGREESEEAESFEKIPDKEGFLKEEMLLRRELESI